MTVLEEVFISGLWSMAHQVLEEYNRLPTTQTTNRLPQNCWTYLTRLNKY